MKVAPQYERWKTKKQNKTKWQCHIKQITSISMSYKTNNECFHSCNGKNIFIRPKQLHCQTKNNCFLQHFSCLVSTTQEEYDQWCPHQPCRISLHPEYNVRYVSQCQYWVA